ncbi:aspartate kinase [Candidatus Calescamantes bacterium]|nr:aspartate kinase [Candidatus Calescamantes bacterium]
MALIVQKYGGTSVGTTARIKRVAKRIVETRKKGNEVVVVVSAMGKTTDKLIELAKKITPNPKGRELDMLMATGEQASSALLAMAIHDLGEEAISLTGPQVGILTDSAHTKAKILKVNTKRIWEELRKGNIVIVAGFQGADYQNNITTLGRGGSDTTAVALAAALKADICEIYTDVEGVYTADPRIVPEARKIDVITYEEMLELAGAGAKVLQSRAVEFASKYNVKIHVKSSFSKKEGTVVMKEVKSMEDVLVRGVALSKNQAKISIDGVPDVPGTAAKIFTALAKENINIDLIVQGAPDAEGKSEITFTVSRDEADKAVEIIEKVREELGAKRVTCDKEVAKVSIVGVGMRTHPGVAARMFSALAKENINIELISTSEILISCLVREKEGEKAVKILHKEFELEKE